MRTVKLKSGGRKEKIFEVEESAAMMSEMIKNAVEDCGPEGVIPLTSINHRTLAKVLEWCKKHAPDELGEVAEKEELEKWDEKFIKDGVDLNFLYDIIMGADYLCIEGLLDLGCKTVAEMIKGKPVEEMRKVLRIWNDFTPEEEADLRQQNAWAFR